MTRDRLIALALGVTTLVLYGWRLDYSPIHLHYDEIFFGLQAHSIQTTGHDLNGLRMPVYFQLENTMNWYQPIAVYWTALVLTVVPLSDAAIRWPAVLVGAINVVLTFFLARALFKRTAWAIVAAVLLMLTPAHFIHSRVAMDYVYPLPFLIGWAWCMVRYLDRPSTRDIAIAGTCLGIGFFSYIAGTALAPMYVFFTLAVLWGVNDFKRIPIAIGAFAWPLVAAGLFVALYPDVVPHLMGKYGLAGGGPATAASMDPLQRLREAFTSNAVSDWLNRYWSFHSPGYLFVTGGSNLTNSTRVAGVLLPPIALLLLVGVIRAAASRDLRGALLLFGFFTAAIPAAMLPDEFAVDREMAKVPFAILLATSGAEWLWTLGIKPIGLLTRVAAALLAAVAIGYGGLTLASRGSLSTSTPLLIVVAVMVLVLGMAIDRRRNWSPIVVVSLLLVPVLFVPFRADYFDGYRLRASGWFGGNIRGAIEELMQKEQGAPDIYLSTDIPYIRSYWKFYQAVFHREDLTARTKIFDGRTIDLSAMKPGSLMLAAGNDPVVNALAERGELTRQAAIKDRVDQSDEEQFVIYRR